MLRRFAVCAGMAAAAISLVPMGSPAASKEIMELQRDVAGLQDQVRLLKESQDKQLSALTVLVQQALDTSRSSTTGVAVIQNNLQQSLKDMEAKVVTPVAGLSTRLDGMDQDMRALQQNVSDLNGVLNKLQQSMSDLNHAVAILQAPPPPPPAPAAAGGPGGTSAAAPASLEPCPSGTQLYADANRDRSGAKYDVALPEYIEYLRCYADGEFAPDVQFYIGAIHAAQGDYETAAKDFDVVLEKYPKNRKTPDALYAKGMALEKAGHRTDSANEFAEVIKLFPGTDLAVKACEQRKDLGYNCGVPKAAPAKKKK
jgi:TolA-binding protein